MTPKLFLAVWVSGILTCLTVFALVDAVKLWRETRPRTTRDRLDIQPALKRNRRVR